jgi:hypothetical protein
MTDDKIFDLGFPKTGTTSLESALEILGYDVCKEDFQFNYTNYLMALCVNEDFEEIVRISRYWQAFADLPWGGTNLYKTLVHVYPGAKFIVTTRNPDDWYGSLERMLTKLDRNLDTCIDTMHRNGRFGFVYYLKFFLRSKF